MNTSRPRHARHSVELAVGAFLLLSVATLLVLAFASTNGKLGFGGTRYQLIARFGNIGELRVHAPVKIGGVVVGEVARVSLDRKSYSAVVTLSLDPVYKNLPADTSARILTAGLLGERYVGLDPGGDPETLPSGGEIIYTQGAVVLEELIGKFIFGAGGKNAGAPAAEQPAAGTSGAADPSTGAGAANPSQASVGSTRHQVPQEKQP